MSRKARTKSESGIYHVMLRGADRRIIFSDDEDCERFIDTLFHAKEASEFSLFAYCLMGNHVHILLREEKETLEQIFKRIGSSYVYYYNWKYYLRGHLFQDRFKSEPIEDDGYFMDTLRYICQNPVIAGLSSGVEDYPWLACSGVVNDSKLDSIEQLTDLAGEELLEFVSEPCNSSHLDDNGSKRLTDREAIDLLRHLCDCEYVQDIGGWNTDKKNNAILAATDAGISIRQLSRITGITIYSINKAKDTSTQFQGD